MNSELSSSELSKIVSSLIYTELRRHIAIMDYTLDDYLYHPGNKGYRMTCLRSGHHVRSKNLDKFDNLGVVRVRDGIVSFDIRARVEAVDPHYPKEYSINMAAPDMLKTVVGWVLEAGKMCEIGEDREAGTVYER